VNVHIKFYCSKFKVLFVIQKFNNKKKADIVKKEVFTIISSIFNSELRSYITYEREVRLQNVYTFNARKTAAFVLK